jgi:hypothetical protein
LRVRARDEHRSPHRACSRSEHRPLLGGALDSLSRALEHGTQHGLEERREDWPVLACRSRERAREIERDAACGSRESSSGERARSRGGMTRDGTRARTAELDARRVPRWLWALACAAVLVELVLAWRTHGTNDVAAFHQYMEERARFGAEATYANDPDFNHPPFIFHFLLALSGFVAATGLPFAFCLRLPAILASLASFVLVAELAPPSRARHALLALVAAAPAAIMIAGFHGNTDPVMVFFVLFSAYLLERGRPAWLAGAAMGAALNIKVVPLVFLPAVFLWLPSLRPRLQFFAGAASIVAIASAPILFEAPALVARKVLGYSSDYGVWGLAWMLLAKERELAGANHFFRHYGRHVLVAILLALSLWMNRRAEKPPLFRQLGTIAFAFLAFTPGFAVQYLAWLVPWIGGLSLWSAALFSAASGAFLFLVYTCWCQGMPAEIGVPSGFTQEFWSRGLPWDSANANLLALWRGPIVPFGLACWISVVIALGVQLWAIERDAASTSAPKKRARAAP